MPGSFDRLPPDTSLGSVFEKLHGQAQELLGKCEIPKEAYFGEGRLMRPLPGVKLAVESVRGSGQSGRPHRTIIIAAEVDEVVHPLIGIAGRHNATHVPPEMFVSGVVGFSGLERIGRSDNAAYQLRRTEPERTGTGRRQSRIEAILGLGAAGITEGSVYRVARETDSKISGLNPAERECLGVVTQRVSDIGEAVELILDGMTPQQALELIDRPVQHMS